MRLWPLAILDQLPRQQLLGQHRECCALRGKGWGRKHATVDYVFKHPYAWLWCYHLRVMDVMSCRGFRPFPLWWDMRYRGKSIGDDKSSFTDAYLLDDICNIYPEHDAAYLAECIENLARKGVKIEIPKKKARA